MKSDHHFQCQSLQIVAAHRRLGTPSSWHIADDSADVIIVHLAGRMSDLRTEFDARYGSIGPALPGEVWSIPRGCGYTSEARGDWIQFAELRFGTEVESTKNDRCLKRTAGVGDIKLFNLIRCLIRHIKVSAADTSMMEAERIGLRVRQHVDTEYRLSNPGACREFPRLSSYQVRQVRDYIHDNLSNPITIDGLATIAGVTSHHFLIGFREAFSNTPAQYVIDQRIRRAEWQLIYTKNNIARIATNCGFSSHSHLTATFTKRYGFSPRTYRCRFGRSC